MERQIENNKTIGAYRITKTLGKGSYGTVKRNSYYIWNYC